MEVSKGRTREMSRPGRSEEGVDLGLVRAVDGRGPRRLAGDGPPPALAPDDPRDAGRRVAYGLVAVLAVFGLLWDLDDQLLCADEAETALLGLNVLRFGLPVGMDGVNEITILGGSDLNEDGVYVWSPWLDEYVSAASFFLFGRSATAARIPFALMGLASVGLLGWLAWRLSGSHRVVLTTLFLYVTCVPFLLHARQCRYYAILMLAQVWLLFGLHQLLRGRSAAGVVNVALAVAVEFYSNYIVLPSNVAALALVGLLTWRSRPWVLRQLVVSGAIAAVLATPWLLYVDATRQVSILNWTRFADTLVYYLGEIHFHILPLFILLVPTLSPRVRRSLFGAGSDDADAGRREILLFIVAGMVIQLLVMSPAPVVFFRYLTPLVPSLMLLGSFVIVAWAGRRRWAAWALVTTVALTNLAGVSTGFPFPPPEAPADSLPMPQVDAAHSPRSTYLAHLAALATESTDRVEDVATFLRKHAGPEDRLYSPAPEHTLWFHVGVRGIDARVHKLDFKDLPEWIVPVSPSSWREVPPLQLPDAVRRQYREVRLQVHASPPGTRRPDPHAHVDASPPATEPFVILQRKARDR